MNPLFVVPLLAYTLAATLWPAQVDGRRRAGTLLVVEALFVIAALVADPPPRRGPAAGAPRAPEPRGVVVGAGRPARDRLPLRLGPRRRADPQRARAVVAANAPRRGPHGGRDRRRPRPGDRVTGARPRPHARAAGRVRRRWMDHRG